MRPDRKKEQLKHDLELIVERERKAMEALNRASELVSFAPGLSRLQSREPIVAEIVSKANSVLDFEAVSIYLFSEATHDLELASCAPAQAEKRLLRELEELIEVGAVAWVLQREAPRLVSAAFGTQDAEQYLLLHCIATPARVRGVFLGVLGEERSTLSDIQLPLLSIVLQQGAQLLESYELYSMHRSANLRLTENVIQLQAAREELSAAQEKLEEKVEDRTRELAKAIHSLENEAGARQRAQDQLHRREITLRALFNATDNPIIMVDQQGSVLACNDAATQLYGGIELRGKDPRELMPPEHAEAALVSLQEAVQSQKPVYHEQRQGDREYSVKLYPVQVGDEGEIMVAMFGHDVTDRRRAERALRQSEGRYRNLFEDSPISLWEEDCSELKGFFDSLRQQGVQDFRTWFAARPDQLRRCASMIRVVDVNKATVQTYGAKDKSQLLQSLEKLVHEDAMDSLQGVLATLAHGGRSYQCESRNRTLDGRVIDVQVQFNVVPGHEERLDKVVVSILDVTLRKRMERALLEAKETAEAANRAKGQFLANMSHEMRTPLNGVLGMTEILRATRLSDEQVEFTATIQENAMRLMHMVNDLLDLSSIDSQRFVLTRRAFSMSQALERIAAVFAQRCKDKGLAFDMGIDPNIPAWLVGDVERFKQVLVNLLHNAVHYTQQGGVQVCVALAAPMQLGPEEEGGVWLHCSVADTGVGISEERQQQIFESFELGESYLTKRYSGAGLGLAIARAIIEKMGGRIWVQSEQGQGSSFYFAVRFEKGERVPPLAGKEAEQDRP